MKKALMDKNMHIYRIYINEGEIYAQSLKDGNIGNKKSLHGDRLREKESQNEEKVRVNEGGNVRTKVRKC